MAEAMEIPKESLQDLTVCALLHDNALTETRPYKAGMHHKKAIAILQENAASKSMWYNFYFSMPVLTVDNSDLQGTLMQISESVLRCEGIPRQLHSFLQ